MKKRIYLVKHEEYYNEKVYYSFEEIVAWMADNGYYRQHEFVIVYYPDPETGLVYLRNTTDKAIHYNPDFKPRPLKHLDCEYFGKSKNPENLPIRDTTIPEIHQKYYVKISNYDCYEVKVIDIDLDKRT